MATDQTSTQDATATALDIIERLATSGHQWTAVTALSGDTGRTDAVNAAQAAGLVRTATIRGSQMVQFTSRVVSVTRIGEAVIIVTDQPDSYMNRYAVDTWVLPTEADCDPELVDWARRPVGQPYLIDQGGDDDIPGVARMVTEAEAYLASLTAGQAA